MTDASNLPDNVVQFVHDAANPTPPAGGKGRAQGKPKKPKKPVDWGRLDQLTEQYALIYGTDTVFDLIHRRIIKVNAVRLAHGNDMVKLWLARDTRRTVLPEQLVFEPAGEVAADCINLFDGMPIKPKAGDCQPILELLAHLCAESADTDTGIDGVIEWTLKWLALPLQKPGTKMRSALIFHGPQGAGKNLFFEIVQAMYGKYGTTVGLDQLESQFNDWLSQKLFVIGDEVSSRQELYHHKNKLKGLITGETVQINTKMLPLREEANHMNVVFLSNETKPLVLEEGDRRYLVVWTPTRRHDDLYERVAKCLADGGVAAFYDHLLKIDLSGFSAYSTPIMTRAKADLIDHCRNPEERFALEWIRGYLPLPLAGCSSEQLFKAFRRWCFLHGERLCSQEKFSKGVSALVKTYAGREPDRQPRLHLRAVKYRSEAKLCWDRIWVPAGEGPSEGTGWAEYAQKAICRFESDLDSYCDAGVEVRP
jgi:putative DNA primase/helicase